MKKRVLLIITALLLLVAQIPVTAQNARTSEQKEVMDKCDTAPSLPEVKGEEVPLSVSTDEIGRIIYTDSIKTSGATLGQSFTENEKQVRQAIVQGCQECAEEINLYEYRIAASDLKAIVQDMRFSEPSVFHLENSYQYSRIGDYVYDYIPKYKMNQTDYAQACEFVEKEVEKILNDSNAQCVEDDYLQALLLNDYITTHYEYDKTYTNYDMYSMLKDKKGVCQAYTLLYDELLTRCGIEVAYAQSDDMNHIWNLVKIGQYYYHVDVTWNDPTTNRYWRAEHSNFLVSDAGISATRHYNWISWNNIVCSDTTYDNAIFTNSESAFAYCEGEIYYIDNSNGNLCRYVDEKSEGIVVADISDTWNASGQSGFWPGTYSGLVSVDGKLYFNTAYGIGSYDPNTYELKKDIVTVEQEDGEIIGLILTDERTLSYGIAPDPYKELTEIRMYEIPKEEQTLLPSDVNCDGVLNVSDVNDLLTYLANRNGNNEYSFDVNNDGIVNIDDLNTVLIALATA